MRTPTSIVVLGFAFLLTGCAIHPLPENVTRDTTFQIVQKIRCETRQALINIAIDVLRESDWPQTHALANRVAAGELLITQVFAPPYRRDVDPRVHQHFDRFALATVGFDFAFTITEENDNKLGANFRNPLTDGAFTLGLSAGGKFERQGDRKFMIADTFIELHDRLLPPDVPPNYCEQIAARWNDYVYPITGQIGMEEILRTFINLTRFAGGIETTRKFTDTLKFTTTFDASATPKITLNPLTDSRFRLADASATLTAKRTDIHQVAISAWLGPPVTSLAQALRLAGLGVGKAVVLRNLEELRTENFFQTQRNLIRRVDELERR